MRSSLESEEQKSEEQLRNGFCAADRRCRSCGDLVGWNSLPQTPPEQLCGYA
jgi:hypothetical protein